MADTTSHAAKVAHFLTAIDTDPPLHDVKMLLNQPERLALIRRRLSDISWF